MQRTFKCAPCNGGGLIALGTHVQKCPICDGAGQVTQQAPKEPAWYPIQIVAPLNATATGVIQIQNEDFDLEFLLAKYTSPLMLITILEGGKPWTKTPQLNINQGTVPIDQVTGTGQYPFPIYPAYRIRAKEQITVTITDQSGAQNTLNFAMFGKVLRGQATERQAGT
jgi:hypothetical protein